MSLTEVAKKYGRHPVTVRISAQDGSLHATRVGGTLTVDETCAASWTVGQHCSHGGRS